MRFYIQNFTKYYGLTIFNMIKFIENNKLKLTNSFLVERTILTLY